MAINEYYYGLAKQAAEIAGPPIKPEWIYSQWVHETANFTSAECQTYHNLGGVTQKTPNSTPQPDGPYFYKQFSSPEEYAKYFGWYISQYRGDGIYDSKNIEDYVKALKHGRYFTDSLENYMNGTERAYRANFGNSNTVDNQPSQSINNAPNNSQSEMPSPSTVPQHIDIESANYMPVKLLDKDTIENIAKAFGTTPDKITDENGNVITGNRDIGSFVMVPYSQSFFSGNSTYTVQSGDDWNRISERTGIPVEKLTAMPDNQNIPYSFNPGTQISFKQDDSTYHFVNGKVVDAGRSVESTQNYVDNTSQTQGNTSVVGLDNLSSQRTQGYVPLDNETLLNSHGNTVTISGHTVDTMHNANRTSNPYENTAGYDTSNFLKALADCSKNYGENDSKTQPLTFDFKKDLGLGR